MLEEPTSVFQNHYFPKKYYVNPNLKYCSILKPLYELQICKIFSKFTKYHYHFISCNRLGTKSWCKKCSKCAFIFLSLYPFLERNTLNKIFNDDLLNKKENLILFQQLIGQKDTKPFECVGTIEENKLAMNMSIKKNPKPYLLKQFSNTVETNGNSNLLFEYDENNNIPKELKHKLRYSTLKLLDIGLKSDIKETFKTNNNINNNNNPLNSSNIYIYFLMLMLIIVIFQFSYSLKL